MFVVHASIETFEESLLEGDLVTKKVAQAFDLMLSVFDLFIWILYDRLIFGHKISMFPLGYFIFLNLIHEAHYIYLLRSSGHELDEHRGQKIIFLNFGVKYNSTIGNRTIYWLPCWRHDEN